MAAIGRLLWTMRRDRTPAPTCLQESGSPFRPALGMLDCPPLTVWVIAECCMVLRSDLESRGQGGRSEEMLAA